MERCTPRFVNRLDPTCDHVAGSDMNHVGISTCQLRLFVVGSPQKKFAKIQATFLLLQTKTLHLQRSSRGCRVIDLGWVSINNPTGGVGIERACIEACHGLPPKARGCPRRPGRSRDCPDLSGSGLVPGTSRPVILMRPKFKSAETSGGLLVARPRNCDRTRSSFVRETGERGPGCSKWGPEMIQF